jgi:micrococcal nuclease
VDTPESRTSDKEEKVYGLMAKEFVKSYLPKGSTQVLRTHKDGVGKYGRILGEFLVDDSTTVNQLLIDKHHAVAYFGQSKDAIEEEHLKNRELVSAENDKNI